MQPVLIFSVYKCKNSILIPLTNSTLNCNPNVKMNKKNFTTQHFSQEISSQSLCYGDILLPLPFDKTYRYAAKEPLFRGQFVEVPFGNKNIAGLVWDVQPIDLSPDQAFKIKAIHGLFDHPPLTEAMMKLIAWVAGYTLSPLGLVLKLAMHAPALTTQLTSTSLYESLELGESTPLSPRRKALFETLKNPLTRVQACEEAGVSQAVFKALLDQGVIKACGTVKNQTFAPIENKNRPGLRPDQEAALTEILRHLPQAGTLLLDGVTGSGKTHVYLEAIAEVIARGQQALILLPEIALSNQWLEQFEIRFKTLPAVWHSALSPAKRRKTWRALAEGQGSVVVGTRSALFLPMPKLGLIIVDEEHETSFKQEEGVRYNARDMAVVRAKLERIPCLLCSATPSLESIHNAQRGQYKRIMLTRRHGRAFLPEITTIDLRKNAPPKGFFLAPAMREALKATLEAKEQSLLFLNRRGYAPLTLCRHCGYRLSCPNCTSWMVLHHHNASLSCHHCGYQRRLPKLCPECKTAENLIPCGPGVERIAAETKTLFPQARVEVFASDTLNSAADIDSFLRRVRNNDVDILVGTQIVAKGYNFPNLTLVGIVDADLGLSGGDPRAVERSFQLIEQVAGRAGRADKPGRVFVQTHQSEHPVIRAMVDKNREAFYEAELEQRRLALLPPFGRLAIILYSDEDEKRLVELGHNLAQAIPHSSNVQVLGPAPAPIPLIRRRYRHRFIVKAASHHALKALIQTWLCRVKLPKSTRLHIDIDPISFM